MSSVTFRLTDRLERDLDKYLDNLCKGEQDNIERKLRLKSKVIRQALRIFLIAQKGREDGKVIWLLDKIKAMNYRDKAHPDDTLNSLFDPDFFT